MVKELDTQVNISYLQSDFRVLGSHSWPCGRKEEALVVRDFVYLANFANVNTQIKCFMFY